MKKVSKKGNSTKSGAKRKVVIIGAGPAGLATAWKLLRSRPGEFTVKILEESGEIGGISKTVNYKGNRMDIGGHRFFTKAKEVQEFWEEVMPEMMERERVSRIYYKHKFFDYPVKLNWATLRNMGFLTAMRCGLSYIRVVIWPRKPEESLEDFYVNRFGKKLYEMFFEGYTEKLWGKHPRDISAEWGAQRVKGLSVMEVLRDAIMKILHIQQKKVETSLISKFQYPELGPGAMWEKVAEEVQEMSGEILLHEKVIGILRNVKSETKKLNGSGDFRNSNMGEFTVKTENSEFSADEVVSSMAVKDLVGSLEKVPKEVARIARELPYRDFVTVGVLVRKLEISSNGKRLSDSLQERIRKVGVPDNWIYVQDAGVKLGRIQIFNNWSPKMVERAKETVWIGLEYFCAEGDKFWQMSEKKCGEMAVRELSKMGIIREEEVLDFHRERVKKAYPAYFGSYGEFRKVREFLDEIPGLYLVGRNGQHRYNNMDHSVLTGFRAAEVIMGGRKREEIWAVNTEKEYGEEK